MSLLPPSLLLLMLACAGEEKPPEDSATAGDIDLDGDGFRAEDGDCDDGNAAINPGEDEICNGVDEDCDGEIDEDGAVDAGMFYPDADGDGWGDGAAVRACSAPPDHVASGGDCDDGDAAFHPQALEDCADPIDWNCDGSTGYTDNDGDGFAACEECDDGDMAVNPAAVEVCNGVDEDCDGSTDEEAADSAIWYLDNDGDGFGDPTLQVSACEQPAGWSVSGEDCNDSDIRYSPGALELCGDLLDFDCDGRVGGSDYDRDGFQACDDCSDTDAAISPLATEVCDGVDNNCAGGIDEDSATDALLWYADADADGFGDAALPQYACTQPTDHVADSTDCDDARADRYPSAVEYCNGADDDCDGTADESTALDVRSWYADTDADGYGNSGAVLQTCEQPVGYARYGGDCDDTDAAYNPGAAESDCNDPNDYNCDGSTGYDDNDGDGWAACEECNDGNAAVQPDMDESCDGADNDCDGEIDESGAIDAATWYLDSDADGYGDDAASAVACDPPAGYTADNTDCDDSRDLTNPDAGEYCNGEDDDCDGQTDEADALDAATWYTDSDGDSYGRSTGTIQQCGAPAGYAALSGDCDDADAGDHPGVAETIGNSDDEDCDGTETCYDDDDDDGYLDTTGDTRASADADCTDANEGLSTDPLTDCDDGDSGDHPGAAEVCNGDDEDCDGTADNGVLLTFYADSDGDGYGSVTATLSCAAPTGYVSTSTDCDDADAGDHPGAAETIGNSDDENCDSTELCYDDDDDDGYLDTTGDTLPSIDADCADPAEGLSTDPLTDCDDADAGDHPGAAETIGNSDDEDCNGTETCFDDDDDDGFLDTAADTRASADTDCVDAYEGTAADLTTDCDDGDAGDNPDSAEVCNGDDEDCDGTIDNGVLVTFYADGDGDSYGGTTATLSCAAPAGFVSASTDCDDGDAGDYPGAAEICNSDDEDCDGVADNGVLLTFYVDSDGDGWGSTASATACTAPAGYTAAGGDCLDSAASVYPGAVEICQDTLDQDCDGADDCRYNGTESIALADINYTYVTNREGSIGSTAASGDVTGDGMPDLLLGDRGYDVSQDSNEGKVWLLPGGSGGLPATLTGRSIFQITANNTDLRSGSALGVVGDVSADGIGDFGIGAPLADRGSGGGNDQVGQLTIFRGSSAHGTALITDDNATWRHITFTGSGGDDWLGYSVAGVGPMLSGDNVDDWAFGVPGADTGASAGGAVYLVSGALAAGSSYTTTTAGAISVTINGTTISGYLGSSIGRIDRDSDGIDDLLIGANGSATGAVYVFDAPLSGTTLTPAAADWSMTNIFFESFNEFNNNTTAVAAAGDNDGDGHDDLLIGAAGYDITGSNNVGQASLYPGTGTTLSSVAAATLTGLTAEDKAGYSVAGPGDVDNDGYDDLLIGIPQEDVGTSNSGMIGLVYGPASGSITPGAASAGAATAWWSGPVTNYRMGMALSGIGDVDADGWMDMLFSAHETANDGNAVPYAYIIYGLSE